MQFMTISVPKMFQCGPCKHIKTNEIGHVLYVQGPTQKRGVRMLVKYASGKTKWLGYTGFYSRWEMLPAEDGIPNQANLPSTGIVFTDKQKEALLLLINSVLEGHAGSALLYQGWINKRMLNTLVAKISGQAPQSAKAKKTKQVNTAMEGEQHV